MVEARFNSHLMKTGISASARTEITHKLSKLLASSYLLFIKTQNFHWNVTGPHFQTLHTMFETQYNELFAANDEIAERIRALGHEAPGTMKEFVSLAFIKEAQGKKKAETMVKELLADHESIIEFIRNLIEKASGVRDEGTNDVLAPRIDAHEKTAWMLRSFLE